MKKFLLLAAFCLFILSCGKKKGCVEANALNKNYDAEVNDGSCRFSTVTFYASAGFFNGIAISKIDVVVNGNAAGSIPGTFYPGGPGNCSAQGTVAYQFSNGNKVDWNTTVYLANGAKLFGSGQVSPLSSAECIKVNVTN